MNVVGCLKGIIKRDTAGRLHFISHEVRRACPVEDMVCATAVLPASVCMQGGMGGGGWSWVARVWGAACAGGSFPLRSRYGFQHGRRDSRSTSPSSRRQYAYTLDCVRSR